MDFSCITKWSRSMSRLLNARNNTKLCAEEENTQKNGIANNECCGDDGKWQQNYGRSNNEQPRIIPLPFEAEPSSFDAIHSATSPYALCARNSLTFFTIKRKGNTIVWFCAVRWSSLNHRRKTWTSTIRISDSNDTRRFFSVYLSCTVSGKRHSNYRTKYNLLFSLYFGFITRSSLILCFVFIFLLVVRFCSVGVRFISKSNELFLCARNDRR